MKDETFQELLKGVRQAGQIRRGERRPSRVTHFKPAHVKDIRAQLGRSHERK